MEYLGTFGKNSLIFGTWNVRGLTEKKKETFSEIERENVDVVVLTETKLKKTGIENCGKYVHLYSGVRKKDHGQAGVSILIKKDLGFIESWEAVNERIIKAELNLLGRKITIIGVYWVNERDATSIKDEFQKTFKEELQNVKKERELIILGDFNCKICNLNSLQAYYVNSPSKSQQEKIKKFEYLFRNKDLSNLVGDFGDDEINDNGLRLLNICSEYSLKIHNTLFKHADIYKYTWYKGSEKENLLRSVLDLFITRQDTTMHIYDVLPCGWFECGTDHIFLAAFIQFPDSGISDSRVDKIYDDSKMIKYMTYLLYSEKFRKEYHSYLNSYIDTFNERSTVEMYNSLKTGIHRAAHDALGILDEDTFGEFLWDNEVRYLRVRERTEYSFGYYSDKEFGGELKNVVWQGVLSNIENTERDKRSKKAWSILLEMLNKKNENITHPKSLEDFWKEFFEKNETNATELDPRYINHYVIDPKQTIQINVEDVTEVLEQLDDDTGPTLGGLSIQLFRNSSTEIKRLLTNLVQNIFKGEEVPPEIGETYISNNIGKDIHLHVHCIMRLMCFILKEKLENEINKSDSASILRQMSTLDAIFTMRVYLQKMAKKQIPPPHIALIDLKQLYFCSKHSCLFNSLIQHGISESFIAVLVIMFLSIRVNTSNELFKQATRYKWLIEQSALGPTLLKLYIQKCIKEWVDENVSLSFRTLNLNLLPSMLSKDNLIIVSSTHKNLESVILRLGDQLHKLGLHINLENIKYLGKEKLTFGRTIIYGENVIEFDGSYIELDGSNSEEVLERLLETKNAIAYLHPVLRDENITKENKRKIFETFILYILMNGCETWILNKDMKELMSQVERNYWKWCDENYKSSEIFWKLQLLRKQWWYRNKLETNESISNILQWDPEGTNNVGRPRLQWKEDIDKILEETESFQQIFQNFIEDDERQSAIANIGLEVFYKESHLPFN